MHYVRSCLFSLLSLHAASVLSTTSTPDVKGLIGENPGPWVDPGTLDEQHPLPAAAENEAPPAEEPPVEECTVCKNIRELINTPFDKAFQFFADIEPDSFEAQCPVHQPFVAPVDELDGDDRRKLRARLTKWPREGIMTIDVSLYGNAPRLQLIQHSATESGRHPGHAVQVDEEWIDLEVLRGWVSTCREDHGAHCEHMPFPEGYQPQRPGYVIDTSEGRLIESSSISDAPLEYVTLSYVRGSQEGHRYLATTKENVGRLRASGALFDPDVAAGIPRTFRDALELVPLLGYRYLWIDLLCIVQDDPDSINSESVKMGDILAGGVFSIAIEGAIDAEEGIRGIKELSSPQSRSLKQILIPWGEEHFVEPASEKHSEFWDRRGGARMVPQSLRYPGRAWTRQEMFLPRRILRFNLESVEWRCSSCWSWEETPELCGENPLGRSRMWDHSHSSHPNDESGITSEERGHWTDAFSRPWFELREYFIAMNELTWLQLSDPGEILGAAAGLLSAFGSRLHAGFICGLPEEQLDMALLFLAFGRLPEPAMRRTAGPPTDRDRPWPSWSWAGWTGAVGLPQLLGPDFQDRAAVPEVHLIPTLSWSAGNSLDPSAPRRQLQTRLWDDVKQKYMYNGLEAPPLGWTRGQALARYLYSNPKYGKERPGFDASVRYIHESMPDVQFKYPVPLFPPEAPVSAVKFNSERLLFTTTERVYVNVRPSDHFKDGITKVYRLRAASGRAVGFVEPSTPDELVRLFNASEPLPGAKPAGSETGANDEPPAEPEVKLELVSLSQGWSLWTANMAELRDKRTAARTSTERYEFHNVLWVQWKDGVASRYGLGRVMADCWASLEPEAVDLVLG